MGIVALFLVVLVVHPQPPMLAAGSSAPPISLRTSAGRPENVLQSGTGRPVVVEFFETTCVTCQSKAAALCALSEANPGVTFAGVDAAEESAQLVRGYEAHQLPSGCRMVLLLDPGLKVSRAYQVAVVPTVYVVDKDGRIAYGGIGAQGIDGISAALTQLAHGH